MTSCKSLAPQAHKQYYWAVSTTQGSTLDRFELSNRIHQDGMYIPPSFRIVDVNKLSAFMDAHSFATLVTCNDGVPFATHLPMRHYRDDGACITLASHMARANPQWKHFSDVSEVLTVFSGPHAYISPTWYATDNAVPTWNYATVHAYGVPTILEDQDRIVSLLAETVAFYERSFARPWPGILPDELRDKLIDAIVAFEIRVTRIEGKFKLGQNRSADDIAGVHGALASSPRYGDRDLSDLMVAEGLMECPTHPRDGG